jgi:hypothetical protein
MRKSPVCEIFRECHLSPIAKNGQNQMSHQDGQSRTIVGLIGKRAIILGEARVRGKTMGERKITGYYMGIFEPNAKP